MATKPAHAGPCGHWRGHPRPTRPIKRFSVFVYLRARLVFFCRMVVCRVSGTVVTRRIHTPSVMAIGTQGIMCQAAFRPILLE